MSSREWVGGTGATDWAPDLLQRWCLSDFGGSGALARRLAHRVLEATPSGPSQSELSPVGDDVATFSGGERGNGDVEILVHRADLGKRCVPRSVWCRG